MKREYGAQSCAEQFLFLDIHQPKDWFEIKTSKFLLLYNTLRKIIVYELASTFDAIFSYRFTFTEKRYTWTLHLEIMDLDSMVARKFH